MMRGSAICLSVSVALAASGALAGAGHACRLGIVSPPSLRADAELLTARLGGHDVELVERDAIDRILREQALSLAGMTGGQTLRLGRMLKADGLLLLSAPTNDVCAARLVAVNPGVVLWYAEFHAPGKGGAPWPEPIAAALGTYLPKLNLKPGSAVPVSLLRVRPAFDTPRLGQLAGDLNRLLLLRLLREPALFVLEREKLQSARVEADLTGGATDFWSGSYVVEGVVRYDLAQTNQVAFSLSVRPPGAGKVTEWVEAGNFNDLAQLVERAVGKLCRTLGAVAGAAPWDIAAEAARLTALAGGLVEPQERADALGTAMALGRQDVKTAAAYRNALRAVAFRDAERFGGLRLSLAPPPGLGNQAHAFLDLLRFHNAYRPPDGFAPAEGKSWLYGVSPADAALFLEKAVAAGRAGELGELCGEIQAECRHMARRLRDCDPNLEDYRRHQVCVRGARYFHSSTREILAVYREWAFARRTDPRYRVPRGIGEAWYLDRRMADPVFPSSGSESAEERDRLWQAFVEDAAKSDHPGLRINLAILRLAQASRGEAQVSARRELQETLECKTLRSSGVALVKPDSKAGEIPFEALPFEFDLQAQDGLLLESNGMRIRYGWNPKTNKVQPVKAVMRGYSEVDSSPHLKASEEFGFTLSPENGLILLCQNARFHLRVIRKGGSVPEAVPLTFRNQPDLWKRDSRAKTSYFANPVDYFTDVVLTPTTIFVPFFRNRGFWELPYADIQQWLAANPAQ